MMFAYLCVCMYACIVFLCACGLVLLWWEGGHHLSVFLCLLPFHLVDMLSDCFYTPGEIDAPSSCIFGLKEVIVSIGF